MQQIEIPKPENDALLKAELEESAPIKRLPDAKILIVEDNDSIRDMLAGIFKPFYEVLTAADGAEGLALVRSEMPNIVVSDVVMPNMSGTELCKQNKERLQHLPYSPWYCSRHVLPSNRISRDCASVRMTISPSRSTPIY